MYSTRPIDIGVFLMVNYWDTIKNYSAAHGGFQFRECCLNIPACFDHSIKDGNCF